MNKQFRFIFDQRHHVYFNLFLYCTRRLNQSLTCHTNYQLISPLQSLLCNGSVIISTLDDIYSNLSLEEWIYRNYDFSINNEQVLLLWRNRPAVVIGRHQNVWLETSIVYCRKNGIDIVRRNSGGGTVYHDLNNLNISFLTSRKCYNRNRNLTFISNILRDYFQIETEISTRNDLVINNTLQKISGTASKLNGHNSYHHCTLLVNVDKDKLRNSLRSGPIDNIQSNATKSVSSPIINLNSLNNSVTMKSLIEAISKNYAKYYSTTDKVLINQIDRLESDYFSPIINDIRGMFQSWQWIYGGSPKFIISQKFCLNTKEVLLQLVIEKGIIKQIILNGCQSEVENVLKKIQDVLINIPFEESELKNAFCSLKLQNPNPEQIFDDICLAIFALYQKMIY